MLQIRALIAFFLLTSAAWAQTPCIISDPAWVTPYRSPPAAMSSLGYQLANGVLAALYTNNTERAFQGVPRGVAQQMTSMVNPTTFFNNNIVPVYMEGLLTSWASGPCPILAQTGQWILTNVGASPPQTYYIVDDTTRVILTSDSGIRLTSQ